jgi:hypothetical protein
MPLATTAARRQVWLRTAELRQATCTLTLDEGAQGIVDQLGSLGGARDSLGFSQEFVVEIDRGSHGSPYPRNGCIHHSPLEDRTTPIDEADYDPRRRVVSTISKWKYVAAVRQS